MLFVELISSLKLFFGWHYFLVDISFWLTFVFVEICFWLTFFYIASRYQAFTYICNWLTIYVYPPFSTNFEELFLYEREVWVQIDENSYWTPGQFWLTQIGIKLLAFVSPEKIAFLCEVFLKFCLIFVYHTFCYVCISDIFN